MADCGREELLTTPDPGRELEAAFAEPGRGWELEPGRDEVLAEAGRDMEKKFSSSVMTNSEEPDGITSSSVGVITGPDLGNKYLKVAASSFKRSRTFVSCHAILQQIHGASGLLHCYIEHSSSEVVVKLKNRVLTSPIS